MGRTVIEQARLLLRRRKFGYAITILEANMDKYKGSFEYYVTLGTACLYLGDDGNANKYYNLARSVRFSSSELRIGQAAIYLRKGEVSTALGYYLEVLENDPSNEVARSALEFIRVSGDDFDLICRLKDNGKIKEFYPPLGLNPDIIRNCVFLGLLLGLAVSLAIILWPKKSVDWKGPRSNLQKFELSSAETKLVMREEDSVTDSQNVYFMLTSDELIKTYEKSVDFVQTFHDNPAQVEINRILNSNASNALKSKARNLQSYLWPKKENGIDGPGFSSLPKEDNYPYLQVAASDESQALYENCYVSWRGAIANPMVNEDGSLNFNLLVGYEDGVHVHGKVSVVFAQSPQPSLDSSKPIEVLGRINTVGGQLVLTGKSYYQPIKGFFRD